MGEVRAKWIEELVESGMKIYEMAGRYNKMNPDEADKTKKKDREDLVELYEVAYDRVYDK